MAYIDFISGVQGPIGTEQDLTVVGVISQVLFNRPADVDQLQFTITTAVASPDAPVQIQFSKYLIPSSAVGAVVLGTLTLPDGAAAGGVYYKRINPVAFDIGNVLVAEVTVAALDTGMPDAGGGYSGFQAESDPKTPANNAKMVASA